MKLASALALFNLFALTSAENLRRMQTDESNCIEVTLTGTGGGPVFFEGLAGAGTLVTYGKTSDNCRGTNLQFDMGRGTTLQLSKLGLNPVLPPGFNPTNALDAIFLTHIHNDHTDDLYVYMSSFFQFLGNGGLPGSSAAPPNQKIDIVCAEDVTAPNGVTSSCTGLVESIGFPMIMSGEVAQRRAENPARKEGGPSDLANLLEFDLNDGRQEVWTSKDGQVTVEAVGTNHIGGHASYKVNTPVGSVVIGGDASDGDGGARGTTTSKAVEELALDADVLVHSAIHPVFGPDGGSTFPPPAYARQSNSVDIGSMADRSRVGAVMLTHLIPSIGADVFNIWPVPGGALTKNDYKDTVKEGGFRGKIVAGGDTSTVRVPDIDS